MRAPSIDLLRSLRSTPFISPISKSLRPAARLRERCQNRIQPSRYLATTPSLKDDAVAVKATSKITEISSPSPSPSPSSRNPNAPRTRDRGPASKEDTQTDFNKMDILGTMSVPATSVDACTPDGFHLNNGVKTSNFDGLVLLDGEAFLWTPWAGKGLGVASLVNRSTGVLDVADPKKAFGVLDLVYPKPDLLVLGTGAQLCMLSKETKGFLNRELGIRVDVMDTANAAAAYNLLATERGIQAVAALLLPVGSRWNDRAGGKRGVRR